MNGLLKPLYFKNKILNLKMCEGCNFFSISINSYIVANNFANQIIVCIFANRNPYAQ